MIDASLQRLLARPLDAVGRTLAESGVSANSVTLAGLGLAVVLVFVLATRQYAVGLSLLALNRLLDGVDGSIARSTRRTDFGGYLDSVADYVFYAGVPFGLALSNPQENALPAAALLASFLLTGASFLAFAALAAKRGLQPEASRPKAFFYSVGFMEGAETIAFFVAMLLWPAHFAALAWTFSGLCVLTAVQRSLIAAKAFC
jgi:phosphatidylglycerophosphate synthase